MARAYIDNHQKQFENKVEIRALTKKGMKAEYKASFRHQKIPSGYKQAWSKRPLPFLALLKPADGNKA